MTPLSCTERDEIYFKDQFVLSKDSVPVSSAWTRFELNDWVLATHPTFPILPVLCNGIQTGWMLGKPIRANSFITNAFELKNGLDLEKEIYDLSGRWILISVHGSEPRIYMDPLAHLTFVYAPPIETVATTPTLIPDTKDTRVNQALFDLMDIPAKDNWYPFGLTPRHNTFRLLPNHYLDLNTWQQVRWWPKEMPPQVDVARAADTVARVVKDVLDAIASRYPMRLSLTAGHDSRMILACARKYHHEMVYFTGKTHPVTAKVDVKAGKWLAKRFNLEHVILLPIRVAQSERAIWLKQTGYTAAGATYKHCNLYELYEAERASLGGAGGEILRSFYRKRFRNYADIDEHNMLKALRLPSCQETLQAGRAWLDQLNGFDRKTILDLLYQEQRMGCWAGPLRYGGKYVGNDYWPVCNRQLVDIMLGLNDEVMERCEVHLKVIEQEWPELLEIPFNKFFGADAIKYKLINTARRTANGVARKLAFKA